MHFTRRWIIAPIRLYRYFISPLLGNACRFEPTCSSYALEAFTTFTLFKASMLSFKRILRCHPWNAGGFDPIPSKSNLYRS